MRPAVELSPLTVCWYTETETDFDTELQRALDWWCGLVTPQLDAPADLEAVRAQADGFARLLKETLTGVGDASASVTARYKIEVCVSVRSGRCHGTLSMPRIDYAHLELPAALRRAA